MFHILPLALLVAAPAAAQGFKADDRRLTVAPAGVSVPATLPGGMTVTKNDEFTRKGEGIDNVVQWESPDRLLYVSAYVYRPPLADAALAAYATDRAVRMRFGPSVQVAEQASVPLAGRPGTLIRTVYTGAQLEPGKPLVTAAAFATVGAWTLKLRATGPADRQAEVLGALDALVAGTRVKRPADLRPTRPLAFDAPCPATSAREAKLLDGGLGADALIGMMLGGEVQSVTRPGEPEPVAFPAEGATRACVRGTIRLGNAQADVIQPAGVANPPIQLVALSDAGNVLAVRKAALADEYAIKLYATGQVDTLGRLDAQPTPAQLQSWLQQPKSPALKLSSRAIYGADGKQRLQMPGGIQVEAKRK